VTGARQPRPTVIGGREFRWGERTFVMGIVNVTPDSFSGDGLLAPAAVGPVARGAGEPTFVDWAVAQGRRMVADGADLLDVGGESTRPGHADVSAAEELDRVVPVIEGLRRALPGVPISVDTTKVGVAAAALDAGADLVNDIWGVAPRTGLVELVASRRVPIVLMHNRAEARYADLLPEIVADLEDAIGRAVAAGVPRDDVIVDPGFGFGKNPLHNLALLDGLSALRVLGRPILLGASRKSTLGRVLDLPPGERLEATLATTAIGIARGADVIRVHDVLANVRAARMTDAVVRGPSDALRAEFGG
jgi:dihydropteroate synthase